MKINKSLLLKKFLKKISKYSSFKFLNHKKAFDSKSKKAKKSESLFLKISKSESFKNRTDDFQAKNSKNKSKNIRNEEPMDVEPLEDLTTNNSKDMISNDKELIDIEDPW